MLPGYAVYDATKGAVDQFTHILSKEFGQGHHRERRQPGCPETETYRTGKSEQFLASLEAMSAFCRLGQPDEIAAMVAFLASDTAAVTALAIRVNGGTVCPPGAPSAAVRPPVRCSSTWARSNSRRAEHANAGD